MHPVVSQDCNFFSRLRQRQKVAFAALPAEPMIPRASDARCHARAVASEIWISGKPSMAEILCLHIFLSFFQKKLKILKGRMGNMMKHGMIAFFCFFPKKNSRVGFFTTPILVGGPTQATTAARQQFKVDKIKGINDMICHAIL